MVSREQVQRKAFRNGKSVRVEKLRLRFILQNRNHEMLVPAQTLKHIRKQATRRKQLQSTDLVAASSGPMQCGNSVGTRVAR
jgi:hypothetical protein